MVSVCFGARALLLLGVCEFVFPILDFLSGKEIGHVEFLPVSTWELSMPDGIRPNPSCVTL